jgi:S1/P1 Nuclease
MSKSLSIVHLIAFLALFRPISGRGDLGHRTVGYLAQKYFTDAASQLVNSLLVDDSGNEVDISDGAIWADRQKEHMHFTGNWHYIGRSSIFSTAIEELPLT